jgi:hypothetical protein
MENITPNTEGCFNLLFQALGDDLGSPPRKKIAGIFIFHLTKLYI